MDAGISRRPSGLESPRYGRQECLRYFFTCPGRFSRSGERTRPRMSRSAPPLTALLSHIRLLSKRYEPGIGQRDCDAVPRLLSCSIRQPDDDEEGIALAVISLHLDGEGLRLRQS